MVAGGGDELYKNRRLDCMLEKQREDSVNVMCLQGDGGGTGSQQLMLAVALPFREENTQMQLAEQRRKHSKE